MQKQEEIVQDKIDEANNAKELSKDLAKQGELSKEAKELLEQAANKLASEARAEEARLRQQAKQLQADLSRVQQEAEMRFRKRRSKSRKILRMQPRKQNHGEWHSAAATNLLPGARSNWANILPAMTNSKSLRRWSAV